ncbi:MAG TPA: hypothetical protein VE890_16720 [Thermoguttaceae bacterium]|nr:hypothetical protein [Thermoguttaceae bacterium]
MNLAEVLHERWAAATALDAMLPVARVVTGMSVDATMPYATLIKQSERPLTRHHDGSGVDLVVMRIEVFDENYDTGTAVLHAIKAAFDRSTFALSGSDEVLVMQRVNDNETQSDDGVWQFAIDFECTVYLESGV